MVDCFNVLNTKAAKGYKDFESPGWPYVGFNAETFDPAIIISTQFDTLEVRYKNSDGDHQSALYKLTRN